MPRLTPEISNQESFDSPSSAELVDDIFNEPMPPEMNEQAYEAVAEELKIVQVTFQTGLGEKLYFFGWWL